MHIASSEESKLHRYHTWHLALRQPLHFISNRQFSMFTSSLSAWETPMEKSQGGNGILSLRVTAAAWFNETVCQKAKQQPVNKQEEVVYTRSKAKKHDAERLSKTFLPFLFLTHTYNSTKSKSKKKKAHMCTKGLARAKTSRDEDSCSRHTLTHWEASTHTHTHIHTNEERQLWGYCIKRQGCYQRSLQEIPPTKSPQK